jgi:hypothetical protein
LSSDWGWQVQNHHLHKSIGGREESSHDNLEQLLTLLLSIFWSKLDVKLFEESGDLVLLEVHNGIKNPEDRVENELVEGTFQLLAFVLSLSCPLLGMGVKVVVTLRM